MPPWPIRGCFDLLAESLSVPTTAGDLTAAEAFERGGRALHVTSVDRVGFEEMVCRAQGIPVALGARYGVLPFLRRWARRHDAPMVELGTESGDSRLFRPVSVDRATQARLAALLGGDGEEVVAARFEPTGLPLVPVSTGRPNSSGGLRRTRPTRGSVLLPSPSLGSTPPRRPACCPAVREHGEPGRPATSRGAGRRRSRPRGAIVAGGEAAHRTKRARPAQASGPSPSPDFDALTDVFRRLLDNDGDDR